VESQPPKSKGAFKTAAHNILTRFKDDRSQWLLLKGYVTDGLDDVLEVDVSIGRGFIHARRCTDLFANKRIPMCHWSDLTILMTLRVLTVL
jgi:hypothetical protein